MLEKKENMLNYIYKNFIKTENDWKELKKRMIFARAHLCSSSLISWLQRKKILVEKGKESDHQKVRDLLKGSHPDSIDHYFVENFGSGSMYNMKGRMKATDKNFEELIKLIEKSEEFIKEDLEKGTEFEGEFDKRFSEMIRDEEERREYWRIRKEIIEED